MPWIQSHDSLLSNPKLRKLARRLDTSIPATIGHLHLLWWWAMTQAEDGDLTSFDNEDLAIAAHWEGDSDVLVKALIQVGFVDDDPLRFHAWEKYGGKLAEQRRADAERKAASRRGSSGSPTDGEGTSGGRDADVPGMSTGHPSDGGRRNEENREEENREEKAPRKKLLKETWEPKPETVSTLRDRFPAVDIEFEIEKFRDHAVANGRKLVRPDAAFSQWVKKGVKEGWATTLDDADDLPLVKDLQ